MLEPCGPLRPPRKNAAHRQPRGLCARCPWLEERLEERLDLERAAAVDRRVRGSCASFQRGEQSAGTEAVQAEGRVRQSEAQTV